MAINKYIGRFAPSPTGPLHFGSLVTAVASYFQAKHNNGKWLVRIEDIDKEREQKGANNLILKTLEAYHLFWDDAVTYQSTRKDYYLSAINKLQELNKLYRCQCSRKTIRLNIKSTENINNKQKLLIYPGTCRYKKHPIEQPHSLRLVVPERTISFSDTIQGNQSYKTIDVGDFVLQRIDGSISYHHAVALDDAKQNITEVVRGVDLIDSCSKQIIILTLLGYPIPQYCHLPLICNKDGTKLSKQTRAAPLNYTKNTSQFLKALCYLNQDPPTELIKADIEDLHDWTIQNWNIAKISNKLNHLIYM